ncbi:MAG: CaiB/BaiF CoA transferase family protein [Phenylobacterium sp.]
MQELLSGIRIIDLTSVFAGPYCTMTLADLGAEVITVEPAYGAPMRNVGSPAKTAGMGPVHMTIGRGKRSVALDLEIEADRVVLRELLKTADVFIHNISANDFERLGFSDEQIRRLKPDIIHVSVTGYGSDGPYAGIHPHEDASQALTGMTTLLSRTDGDPAPRYLPATVPDKVSGLHAVYATLAALLHKERTGAGLSVEVPNFEAATSFAMVEHLWGQVFVPPVGGAGFPRKFQAARHPFPTADGHMSFVPYTHAAWTQFFELGGRPEVLQDERFSDFRKLMANVDDLYAIVAQITPSRTTAEWQRLMRSADSRPTGNAGGEAVGINIMPVNDLADVIHDPHLVATGFFREREHPTEGRYREMAPPVRFAGLAEHDPRPPPRIGEHNSEVLAELGLGRGA